MKIAGITSSVAVTIYDPTGRKIKNLESGRNGELQINSGNLPAGVLFVSVKPHGHSKTIVRKVINLKTNK